MKKLGLVSVSLLLVLGLAVCAAWLFDSASGSKPYVSEFAPKRSRTEVVEACNALIQQAVAAGNAAIDGRAAEFASFIEGRKAGVGPFSRELVSWYGKWRAVKPYLPFTESNGHKQYVEETFVKQVFTREELSDLTRRVVTESTKDLEEIENRLAVAIRQEIAGGGPVAVDASIATQEFSGAIERVKWASRWDAAKAGGSLAASEAVAVVGTQVLIRLGVSAGLLGAGAVSSWWTLGAGIVLGLVADQVWEVIDDPAGDIERDTLAALDKVATNGSAALRDELGTVLTQRRELWAKAVEEMVS